MRKNRTKFWFFLLILSISWSIPIYGVIYNQIYPSYASALGVAYGFMFGCFVHSLILFLWLGIRRAKLQKHEVIILIASFCMMIILTLVSNYGTLSRIN